MALLSRIDALQLQIIEHERLVQGLKRELAQLQVNASKSTTSRNVLSNVSTPAPASQSWQWPLEAEEYKRYGRQLILPDIGLQGQLRLKSASVLLVGLGGLGCPAASYLAGAGVGTLGLMDGDTVELSNLHRQVLHTTERVGKLKVESARDALQATNPLVCYNLHKTHLNSSTALQSIAPYDLVLDCTDSPTTRYLISDAAVLAGKPLISASALRMDGQLLVLNRPPTPPLNQRRAGTSYGGPCYRCVFPKPPPADAVLSCGEGGILGPVVGVMGVLMALEAVKLLTGAGSAAVEAFRGHISPSMDLPVGQARDHSMLIFSATSSPPFRSIRLKGKRAGCIACSPTATVTAEALASGTLDHVAFCGLRNPIQVLGEANRVNPESIKVLINEANAERDSNGRTKQKDYVLLDVRDEAQFGLCALDGSINVPWAVLDGLKEQSPISSGQTCSSEPKCQRNDPLSDLRKEAADHKDIYTICRFGNDSQLAVEKLQKLGFDTGSRRVQDVRGGFKAWKQKVDPNWPEY